MWIDISSHGNRCNHGTISNILGWENISSLFSNIFKAKLIG